MSRQKGRRVPPPDPNTIRSWEVVNQLPSEQSWDEAEQNRTLDAHLVAAGVVQNRVSGLWHTWISLYGTDLTSWYVGDDRSTAHAILMAIQKLMKEWRGSQDDIESMNALLQVASEKSTDPQATLPDDQVREALAEVAKMNAITWFANSPDAGDLTCICSWCYQPIGEHDAPIIRLFDGDAGTEARFHRRCASDFGVVPGMSFPEDELTTHFD